MLDDGERGLLLDCGPGTIGNIVRSALPLPLVQALLVSHLHMDHVHGFPEWLAHLCFPFGITPRVYGPEGTRAYVDLAAKATGLVTPIPGRGFGGPIDVPVLELSDGREVSIPEAQFRAIVVPHAPEVVALAYRVTMAGATVAYSGDTRADVSLMVPLAEGADVLIHEAYSDAGLDDWTRNDSPGKRDAILGAFERTHTRVDVAASIAKEAGVRRLVLTHMNPGEQPDRLAAEARAVFGGEVVVAEDGLVLTA